MSACAHRPNSKGSASLRAPGGVLLVSCYELGHLPHGITMPAGFLRRAGFAPRLLDIAVEAFDDAAAARAGFVGIAVPMHTALRLGVRVAQRVRAVNPHGHICFYGLYASLNADYLLAHGADSCIGGETEEALAALLEALEADGPIDLPGVVTAGRPAAPVLARLEFPVPDRTGLPPLKRYAHLEYEDKHRLVGYVEASRGCKHRCLHCPIVPVYDGRFFVVPRDVVLAQVRDLVADGAEHITFGDPDFLNGPGHVMPIARELHAEFPALTFDFTTKIEHILKHADLFSELAELGCLFVISAVESFNDTVLENLNKGHTREDIFTALDVLREAGIVMRPSLLPFTPWSTLDEYLDLFDVVEAYGLVDAVDPVQYSVRLLVPPGSALLGRPEIQPYLGPLDQPKFTYTWTHPDPRMDELQAAVAAEVERASGEGEDPLATFYRLRALAQEAAGGPVRAESSPETYRNRARIPRLTESWFC